MPIDWITVGAQTLNFLVLVWLMKRFLFKPILRAIDAREERIAAELADADARKAEAGEERDELERKNEEFDRQRADLLAAATDEAKAQRQQLLDEARQAADVLTAKRQEALQTEARSLGREIGRRTQQEVLAIARKVLADLATTDLEERLGEVFTRRLRDLDDPARTELALALKEASDPAVVRSSLELPKERRAAVQSVLDERFDAQVPVRFETSTDVICGIELTAGGTRVAWSIADYLGTLEESVAQLLAEVERPGVASETETDPSPALETQSETKQSENRQSETDTGARPDLGTEAEPAATSP